MGNWKQILIKSNDTLEYAIEVLNQQSLRIVMVVDEYNKLLGTITDGDIRRALIRHCEMNTSVCELMFTSPTTASLKDSREDILLMMKEKDLLQVPIIDEQGGVVGLETLHHLLQNKKLDNPVVLMAGGFGKRLRPLTNELPKPLLKVGSKPILETILTQFIDAGFYRFFISTHYKAEMVRSHFGNGSKWGVEINYLHEEEPLGTAGALGLLPKEKIDLPVIMMNGDLLTKIDFYELLKFYNEHNSLATMCVREYDFQVPYGVIEADGHNICKIKEKPVHKFFVNAGVYVLSTRLIDMVKGDTYLDMPVLLEERIKQEENINMFPVHEYWLDIGRIDEFERAQKDIFGEF